MPRSMCLRAILPCLALAATGPAITPAGAAPGTATAPASAPAVRYVIVLDFVCKSAPEYGAQLADSVRQRLGAHKQFSVIDGLTTKELAPVGGVGPDWPDDKAAAFLKDRAGAHVAILGWVDKSGQTVRAEVRCVDISGRELSAWTKPFSDASERARGEIARQIVEAVVARAEWKPPEYGDEKEPANFSKRLNANGDFESDKGWQPPDNVTSFLVADPRPGRKGKVLRIFTDVERDAWLKYQQDLRLGKADPKNPPKIGTIDNKYGTVAGLEGVHFRSDWIEARGLQRYWLVADMKGRTFDIFFPKVFVKGFADFSASADGLSELSLNELKMTPDRFAALDKDKQQALIADDARRHPDRYRREVYRWYLSCRNEQDQWQHYAAPFPPRGGLPRNVQWLRIEIYAYWPPGEFLFDDVHLYADPNQTAPLPEEPARTPGFKPATTQAK